MSYSFGLNKKDSSSVPRSAINLPVRPGGVDPRAQQVDVFPLDAFEFDDPKLNSRPIVRLKSPWVWEVQSDVDQVISDIGDLNSTNKLTPSSKKELLRQWRMLVEMKDGFDVAVGEAGIPGTNQIYLNFVSAYAAVDTYLWGTPGVLLDLTNTSTIIYNDYIAIWRSISETEAALRQLLSAWMLRYGVTRADTGSTVIPVVPTLMAKAMFDTVYLYWSKQPELTGVETTRIERSDDANFSTFVVVATVAGYTFTDQGLSLGGTDDLPAPRTYYYRVVRIVNGLTESVPSLTASVVVQSLGIKAIAAAAVSRAKLESGLQTEISTVTSEVFPYGLGAMSDISRIDTLSGEASTLATGLMEAVSDTEEGILAQNIIVEDNVTKVATLQATVEGLNSLVGELLEGTGGQIVDLTEITQNKANIKLSALSGKYIDYDTNPSAELSTYSLAQINILKDQIALTVESDGQDGWQVASTIITDDSIASKVAESITTNGAVQAAVSAIVQESDAITIKVAEAESRLTEGIDAALVQAQSGILVTSQKIELVVQAQGLENEELHSSITIEADRITSEVSRATESEGTLASQIVQTADSINLAVFGTEATPGPLPTVQSQLAITRDSIAAQVEGDGAEAVLAMSITLPAQIAASTRASMVVASSEAKVAAVYSPQEDGTFVIGSSTLTVAYKALKADLRTAGLLGSQITLDADEILLGGMVKAANIDVFDLNAKGSIVVGQSQVTGLDTALIGADVAARNALAYKLGYADWSAMQASARLGSTLISGGFLRTELIDTEALVAKKIDCYNGTFRGSIVSGPLELTVAPPFSDNFSTTGNTVVLFCEGLDYRMAPGTYACSGTYNGVALGSITFSKTITQQLYGSITNEHYVYDRYESSPIRTYYYDKYINTWNGYIAVSSYSVSFYDTNGVIIDATAYGSTYPLSMYSSLASTEFAGQVSTLVVGSFSPTEPTAPTGPGSLIEPGTTSDDLLAGTVSFPSGAYTMKYINLPAYSANLSKWTCYLAPDGTGNYILKVKG